MKRSLLFSLALGLLAMQLACGGDDPAEGGDAGTEVTDPNASPAEEPEAEPREIVSANDRFVMASSLSLRAGPRGDAEVLTRLPINTKVVLLPAPEEAADSDKAEESAWSQVSVPVQGLDGWVASKYLSRKKLTAASCREQSALAAQEGDQKGSVSWLERAFALEPDSMEAMRELAAAYRKAGSKKKAEQVEASMGWLQLKDCSKEGKFELFVGQERCGLRYSKKRKLTLAGRSFKGFKTGDYVDQLAFSFSPNGQHALGVTFDDHQSQGYLLDLRAGSATNLGLGGPPLAWASWSPDGSHAMVGSYYEADMALFGVTLADASTKVLTMGDTSGKVPELDLESVSWPSPTALRFRLTTHCDPYDDRSPCDDRRKVIDSYVLDIRLPSMELARQRSVPAK